MDEIKFRAWSELDSKMYQCDMEEDIQSYFKHQDGITLMQFTGRKDSNTKEIYEYDIFKFYHKSTGDWFGFGVCFYDADNTCYKHSFHEVHNNKIEYDSQRPSKRFWSNDSILCEIVGNIYEDPELLKQS